MFFIYFVSCLIILHQAVAENHEPVVHLKCGSVKGVVAESSRGNQYHAFYAIPYAKPPVGSRRFQAPETAEPWDDVFHATKDGAACPQLGFGSDGVEGDEDCLTVNVYVPQLKNENGRLLPVMVSIHGGGFIAGTGNPTFTGPQYLMDYPVVLVSFNYRLGVLGFLNTEDEQAYGNYGMLDQVEALRWVQRHIDSFGGDPKHVTIFGCSAGSASVIYHLLSPLSTGLFHKAIAQSGSATNHWAINRKPLEWAKMFATAMGCPNNKKTKEIVECLREKTTFDLVKRAREIRVGMLFPNDLVPSVEAKGGPGFLTDDPHRLLEEGRIANKVPLIMGMTSFEGFSIHYDLLSAMKSRGKAYYEEEFVHHLPLLSPVQSHMSSAIQAIQDEYLAQRDLDDSDVFTHVTSQILGDAMFGGTIAETVDQLSRAELPVYAYVYDYKSSFCVAIFPGQKCGNYTSHGAEMFFQFQMPWPVKFSDSDVKMASILNTLWTDFAHDKELMIKEDEVWPKYDVTNRRYVELNLPPTIESGPLSDKMEFWTKTIPKLIADSQSNNNIKTEL